MKGLIMCFMLIMAAQAHAQQQTAPFEGKVFTIDNYIEGKFDNREDLTFHQQKLEGSVCIQYGFDAAPYKTQKDEHGDWTFTCVMTSEEEGTLSWEGTLVDGILAGKCLWTKEGQQDIVLTYKGKLKS